MTGSSTHWLPFLVRSIGNWRSCFTIKNLDQSATANVSITYYWDSGSYTDNSVQVPAHGVATLCQNSNTSLPTNKQISTKVSTTSEAGIAVAVNVQDTVANHTMSYSGIAQPSKSVVLPRLYYDWGTWASDITVQNTASASTTPHISYYDHAGDLVSGPTSLGSLAAGRPLLVDLATSQPDDDFHGSAVITASLPIAAVVHTTRGSGSGDRYYMYNGVNR